MLRMVSPESPPREATLQLLLRHLPGRPSRCQLLSPSRSVAGLSGLLIELHEALEGLSQAVSALRRDCCLAPLHSFVAGQQQRLGIGVFFLAQERAAELRFGVEG